MIKTVTLNPAVDKTIEIENFKIDSVNRVVSTRLDAGGKGINVSKIIDTLQGESTAFGLLAGRAGEYIKGYLDDKNIKNDFVFIEGETRTNIKVVDKYSRTNTDINEAGPKVSRSEIEMLENKIFNDIDEKSIIVLSGSVPADVDKKIYGTWIEKGKKLGAKTILDADGELFKEGIKAGPYLIKPNIHELEKFFDKKIEGIEELIDLSKSIFSYGVEVIVISLGSEGALFMNKEKTILAHGIKVEVKSTVGAGDSMVAALAYSIEKQYSLEKMVALSVASGTANVMTSGTQPSELKDILEIEKQVTFEYLNNLIKVG